MKKVFLIQFVFIFWLCFCFSQATAQIRVGKEAPDIHLPMLNGEIFSLKEEMSKGNLVVLNFWFKGCKPCRDEIKDLTALANEYKNKKVTFLALSIDNPKEEQLQAYKEFIEASDFRYQHALNARSVARDYGVTNFPTHVIIENGKVIFSASGFVNLELIRDFLP